jgi:hypothetical protein
VVPKLTLIVMLSGAATATFAQKTGAIKTPDLTQVRANFTAALGKDFEIVKDEFKQRSNTRGGGSYLLMHVRAKHAAYFMLTYRYNYNDSHYSHVERDFNLSVGDRGCRRGPPHLGSYSKYCAGDTIIIPIALNNFSEHQFKLRSRPFGKEDETSFDEQHPEARDQGLEHFDVNNPIADHMRYVGSRSSRMLHRNGGYTWETYATFEAVRPGRFNLEVSAAPVGPRVSLLVGVGDPVGVPIIVVARDTPVTLLASHQEVRGYTMGYNGQEYVSSTSSDAFMSELLILQPGDRISLLYHTMVRSPEFERSEPATEPKSVRPMITKLTFALNPEYDFSEWLVDYLPR